MFRGCCIGVSRIISAADSAACRRERAVLRESAERRGVLFRQAVLVRVSRELALTAVLAARAEYLPAESRTAAQVARVEYSPAEWAMKARASALAESWRRV